MDRKQQTFPAAGKIVSGLLQALLVVLLALPVLAMLTVVVIIIGVVAYNQLVPVATAETFIPELKASVRLELY